MVREIDQLVTDVIAATGASAPGVLADDSPALSIADDAPIYLIGLIGGKDVGKSSLVNALVGLPISAASAAGPGTESVVAYAHSSARREVEELLQRAVPGKFSVVTHENPALSRQVLVDLPDIDSVYADHIETTRRMLRHLLYPIWLQSIEKYADQQPQRLLARVAEGNDPRNFLFAVNKIDLLVAREGESAARELCDDFGRRVAKTLSLETPPAVFALSATHPNRFDLPALRTKLSQQRPMEQVRGAIQLASFRRDSTLLRWLSEQNLAARADSAQRTLEEAEELVSERLVTPLLETALPQWIDTPAHRAMLIEPAVRTRMNRWPIVSALDATLSPILTFVQKHISFGGGNESEPSFDATPLSHRIATTFAHLHRTTPNLAQRFGERKLWDESVARSAAAELQTRLRASAERQKQAIVTAAGGRTGILMPLVRILLTVGAILWFPIVQPILHAFLSAISISSWGDLGRLIVEVLDAAHMLRAGTFLLIWFGVLWLLLRWFARNRAESILKKWNSTAAQDATHAPAAVVMQWSDDLLEPLRTDSDRLRSLAERERTHRIASAEREAA